MPSPPSAQMFLFLSFIVFLAMSAEGTKEPKKYKVGESAIIECWNSSYEKHDMRKLSLYEKTAALFTLWISNGDLSKELEVSGTFDDFTWRLTQETSSCTNGSSKGSTTLGCSHLGDEDNKIFLSRGGENIASLEIDSNYRRRIRYSGTIRNLTVALNGLVLKDDGCYSCKWKEFGGSELDSGSENCLKVENPAKSSGARHFCIASAIVNGVLIGYLLFF